MSARRPGQGGLALLGALIALLGGCQTFLPPPDEPEPPPFEFRLGAGDRVRVSVWGEEKLEHDLQLGPAGSVAFPLIGDVELQGLTLDEARVELAQRLRAHLVDPVVSLSLLEMRSYVVHVLGEVRSPGSVPFVRGGTVIGAIQAAGSFLPATADLAEVRLLRDRLGKHEAYLVDVEAILAGERRDVWLRPGDAVYVPARLLARWDRWWRQAFSPWGEPVDALGR